MNAAELYYHATALGLRLEARGERLAVIPAERVPHDFANELRKHKSDLLDWLSRVRISLPESLPLDPVYPVQSQLNARSVLQYVTNQMKGADSICEWCLKRELAYMLEYRWPDQICAYAAARDLTCWQFNRSEEDVINILIGFKF